MTELTLGRLGYGAANVGNLYRALTDDEAWRTLEAAWDSGVRYFDTAPHYGLGLSERRLGAFLATKPRDEFVLSTKVGRLLRPYPEGAGRLDDANDFAVPADLVRVWDFTADGVRRSLDESLERLGLDAVDVLFLHDPERHDLQRGLSEGLPALAALRDEGLVSAIGVGSMDTEALLAAARSGVVDLLMVAGRLTLVDQSVADQVLPACRAHQVGIVAAAVFNSGLLATDAPSAGSRYDYHQVPSDLLARTRRIAEVCAQYDVPLPVAALQYPLQQREVRSVVVGGAGPEQVRQNAARLDVDVPAELWKRLDAEGLVVL
ncbi:MAG: aldo/keto reductase [Nocardioidaceae bacterium]